MQPLQDSVEKLVSKIELLAKDLRAVKNNFTVLKQENKELKEKLNQYKAEIHRLRSSDQEVEPQQNGQEGPDYIQLKTELEQYIGELDTCLEKLKKL